MQSATRGPLKRTLRKRSFRFLLWSLLFLLGTGVFYALLVRPWFLNWGSTEQERQAQLPGDELILQADSQITRAITIQATPREVWPWLIQLGAGRGGFYSYTWLEGLIGCKLQNAERIEPGLQALKKGDTVRLCPEGSGPPIAYTVARLDRERALVLGVKEGNHWPYIWSLVLQPQPEGTTRLIVRTRTENAPGWQKAIELGVFIMERGMMLGIKTRSER